MFLEASGGFTEEGKIVKGVASEYINGALPLYICPEHWYYYYYFKSFFLGKLRNF